MKKLLFCSVAVLAAFSWWSCRVIAVGEGDLEPGVPMLAWAIQLLGFALMGLCVGAGGKNLGSRWIFVMTLMWAGTLSLYAGGAMSGFFGAEEVPQLNGFLSYSSPGYRYVGSMWSRILALAAMAGLLVALVASSLAYLFVSSVGRKSHFEWRIARRQMSGTAGVGVTAAVAVLGIALGVASLITVTGVMTGYIRDIESAILGTNAHVTIGRYGRGSFVSADEVKEKLKNVPGVLGVASFGFNEAMMNASGRGLGMMLKGVEPELAPDVTDILKSICSLPYDGERCEHQAGESLAKFLVEHDSVPGMLVGKELFRAIGKPLGSVVEITTPAGISGLKGKVPRRMSFRMTGIFQSGMHDFDVRLAYVDLKPFQKLLGMGDAVTGVEVRVDNPHQTEAYERTLLDVLGGNPYNASNWYSINRDIFQGLQLQKVVMYLVLCGIVLVASFNIASTLFMSVIERSQDIAVLQSMGATPPSIMKIFVFQGWSLGAAGTLFGVILGLFLSFVLSHLNLDIAADVYMVDHLSVMIKPYEVLGTVIAALAIAHLATVYPSLQAARKLPVEGLRQE